MGNWRTVNIAGTVSKDQAAPMRLRLTLSSDIGDIMDDFDRLADVYCLSFSAGLCGLGQWVDVDGRIHGQGNLAERDYSLDDIESALNVLAKEFDTLDMRLHAGGDWESTECVATFVVNNGVVFRFPPQVEHVAAATEEDMRWRLLGFLTRRGSL